VKLLYVVHQFFPRHITGTEQYVLSLASEAKRNGHEVEIYTLEPDFDADGPALAEWSDEVEGLTVHRVRVERRLFTNPVLAEFDNPVIGVCFERTLERLQPDLVHFFHTRYLGVNLIEIARARGLPVVAHLMDFWLMCTHVTLLPPSGRLCGGPNSEGADCFSCGYEGLHDVLKRGAGERLVMFPEYTAGAMRHTDALGDLMFAAARRNDRMREVFRLPDAVIAPSRFLRDVFENNDYDVSKVRVMPYGIDPGRLVVEGEAPPVAEGATLRVGYIGTIAQHKGLHVVLDAFDAIDDPGVRLAVYGRLDDFPDYADDRVQQAESDARIVFHGGFERGALGRVMRSIDLLVVPSLWYENTPFVVLEALAAGVPVVASDLGGMTEAFEDGKTGYSFPAGDGAALAEILRTVAADPGRLDALRGGIPAPHTLADDAHDLESLYRELITETTTMSDSNDAATGDQAELDRLRRLVDLRERQARDLYDQVMTLTAARLRDGVAPPTEETEEPSPGEGDDDS